MAKEGIPKPSRHGQGGYSQNTALRIFFGKYPLDSRPGDPLAKFLGFLGDFSDKFSIF